MEKKPIVYLVVVADLVVVAVLVVVLVILVVEATLVVVVVGLVFWQVAPLQNPVIAPLMQGTPCFLRTLVSQTIPAAHLGLLWHGPILLPQSAPALLGWHAPKVPGAPQQGPPSHPSVPSFFPLPQKMARV